MELVIVLVVAALLVYFAVRSFEPKAAIALQQAERLRDDLRHIQMLALTLGKPLQFKRTAPLPAACPAATYWVIDCTVAAPDPCTGAPNTPIVDPATGRNFCVTLEPGLVLAGANRYFDALGRPRNAAILVAGNTTYTITGGGPQRRVVLTRLTGFVTAQ